MPRRPRRRTEAQVRVVVALVLVALLTALAPAVGVPSRALAAEAGETAEAPPVTRSSTPSMTVTLAKPTPSVAPTGALSIRVDGSLSAPADELSVRLRMRRPNGKLVYQRTLSRSAVPKGKFSFEFSRELGDLDLKEGRYALEAYVTAGRLPPVTLTDRLFVLRPGRGPVSLVVVTRFDHTPMMDPEGRFVVDPARETQTRDEVAALGSMLVRAPWLKLSLGVSPLMLDEWRRAAGGYELVGTAGVTKVGKDAPVATTYGAALASLGRTARDTRVQLLDVPYSDPDLSGLKSMGGMDDLRLQFDRGFSVYSASLGTTPSVGVASLGDAVPQSALQLLVKGGKRTVLLDPCALAVAEEATAAPGVYTLKGSRVRGLVIDERASALLGDKTAPADELVDRLFEHLLSRAATRPLVASVHLGPGSRTDVASLDRALRDLARTGLVRFDTVQFAANTRFAPPGSLRANPSPGRPAPAGYWADLGVARTYARAYVDAVSERDEDAMRALYSTFVAESRYWAGPDQRWGPAARGHDFADAALASSRDVLDNVSVTTQTITLSGASGKIPLSVKNGSGKTLTVSILTAGSNARFPSGRRMQVVLRPADNFVTIPVDLGAGSLSDQVRVSIISGRVVLAQTTVDVRASYLDRLALVGLVVLVLVGLLLYIRHKVRAASADT